MLLSDKFWSKDQLLAVCKGMTVHEVETFGKEMFRAFHTELFVHGNATEQTTRENSLVELRVQLIREPPFNQLRTVEQLGYIVWTGPRLNAGTLALQPKVQGPKCPDLVLERMEAFLEKEDIVAMSDEEFEQQMAGLITR